MKNFILSVTLAMSLGLGTGFTQAVTLTFAYEGVIDETDGGAAFGAFLGEAVRVEYTFNDTSMGNVDTNPLSNRGTYTLSAFTATVGGNSYSGGDGSIFIFDNLPGGSDTYSVDMTSVGVVGPTIGGLSFENASIAFTETTATFFTNDELPLIQPDPSAFDFGVIDLLFEDGVDDFTLRANILTVSAVPVPAAVWLFGSGLLGLIGISRRKKAA